MDFDLTRHCEMINFEEAIERLMKTVLWVGLVFTIKQFLIAGQSHEKSWNINDDKFWKSQDFTWNTINLHEQKIEVIFHLQTNWGLLSFVK